MRTFKDRHLWLGVESIKQQCICYEKGGAYRISVVISNENCEFNHRCETSHIMIVLFVCTV